MTAALKLEVAMRFIEDYAENGADPDCAECVDIHDGAGVDPDDQEHEAHCWVSRARFILDIIPTL